MPNIAMPNSLKISDLAHWTPTTCSYSTVHTRVRQPIYFIGTDAGTTDMSGTTVAVAFAFLLHADMRGSPYCSEKVRPHCRCRRDSPMSAVDAHYHRLADSTPEIAKLFIPCKSNSDEDANDQESLQDSLCGTHARVLNGEQAEQGAPVGPRLA